MFGKRSEGIEGKGKRLKERVQGVSLILSVAKKKSRGNRPRRFRREGGSKKDGTKLKLYEEAVALNASGVEGRGSRRKGLPKPDLYRIKKDKPLTTTKVTTVKAKRARITKGG